jgi:hypothetical protein
LVMDHVKYSQMPDPTPAANDSTKPSGDALPDEPKVEPKQESMNGTIVMYTEDWCRPCRDWKAVEQKKVLDAGWKFETKPAMEGMRIPKFEVYGRGRMIEHTGYMTMATLRQIVKDLESSP